MEHIHLQTGSAPYDRVLIHPIVTFNILDHWIRRLDSKSRVIGALVGSIEDNVVEIRSCFPIPHTEGEQVCIKSRAVYFFSLCADRVNCVDRQWTQTTYERLYLMYHHTDVMIPLLDSNSHRVLPYNVQPAQQGCSRWHSRRLVRSYCGSVCDSSLIIHPADDKGILLEARWTKLLLWSTTSSGGTWTNPLCISYSTLIWAVAVFRFVRNS